VCGMLAMPPQVFKLLHPVFLSVITWMKHWVSAGSYFWSVNERCYSLSGAAGALIASHQRQHQPDQCE